MTRPRVSSTSHRANAVKECHDQGFATTEPSRNTLTRACTRVRARKREREREREKRERERERVRTAFWIIRECVRGFVFGHGFVQPAEQRGLDNDPLSVGDKDTAANWRDPPWLEYTGLKLSFFSRTTRWLIASRVLSTSMHRPVWRKNAGPGESRASFRLFRTRDRPSFLPFGTRKTVVILSAGQ